MATGTHTAVEIFGRQFELRSSHPGEQLEELARFVDRRMRELAEVSPHVDTAKLAVLTALNIADELFREQETEPGTRTEKVRKQLETLVARVDSALQPDEGEGKN